MARELQHSEEAVLWTSGQGAEDLVKSSGSTSYLLAPGFSAGWRGGMAMAYFTHSTGAFQSQPYHSSAPLTYSPVSRSEGQGPCHPLRDLAPFPIYKETLVSSVLKTTLLRSHTPLWGPATLSP